MKRNLGEWLAISRDPNVILAQYGELKRQVPLLYTLLILNASAVTYTHFDSAPRWATVGLLGVMVSTCCWRIIYWIRAPNASDIGPERIRAALVNTTRVAGVLGAVFLAWSLLMNRNGTIGQEAHIAVFIAVTVIGCIFCLSNFPLAAMLVTGIVTVPYLIYYIWQGDPVFTAMALNIALVTGVMVRVLLNGFRTFTNMILSKAELVLKQEEAERLNAENTHLANTDALTGLPNRRNFFNRLEEWLRAAAERDNGRMAVCILDLDRFKAVNDTYGHAFGDRLLAELGERLASFSRKGVSVARLGGDEFGVLFAKAPDDVESIGQAVCDALSRPVIVDGQSISVGCSAGVAIYPDAGHTAHELFYRSDYAAYHMKLNNRGGCTLFSSEHEVIIRSETAVETALLDGNFDDELNVFYQPIICTRTNDVLSVEALGRWTSPTVGSVPPDRFIVAAEKINIINSITIALFRKSLHDFSSMPSDIRLSFNLSAKDITSPETINSLIELVNDSGVDPNRITFELTETSLMRDFESAVRGIQSLRALGSGFALDDFGVGYSSLSHLRRLPFDKVKLDRSFLENMEQQSSRKIFSGILALCRTLELDCVAEGVETEAQLEWVKGLGCDGVQGYYFAKPMCPVDLTSWLASR